MSTIEIPPPSGGLVYTTKQAAELTGVPEATIRSWKGRRKFTSDHCIKDEGGNTLWTEVGLQEIHRLSGATECDAPTATQGDALPATPCDPVTAEVTTLLAPVADAIAIEVLRQYLPQAVRVSIHRLLTSTEEEDQRRLQLLLQSMGLVLAANALNTALRHAISTSKQSLKSLEASE